jgi:uncharacterized protein YndB with AHSA1/START domain
MVHFDVEIEIDASPARVWAVLVDVERWPEWMASYTSVEWLGEGPLRVGSAARVRQPGLSAATYTVTELVAGVEFTWSSTTAGVRTTGRHVVRPRPDGRAALALSIEQSGVLAGPVGLLLGRKIRRFLTIESEGLRAAAETASTGENPP